MSLAGVHSNRGDGYQTLIAAKWAIRMLSDTLIQKIEVDSTSLDTASQPILVDDVVIYFTNGGRVYCQCKKNQPDFRAWSFSDIEDELKKAFEQHRKEPNAKIIFYSRNDFGDLAKLRDHLQNTSELEAYKKGWKAKHRKTHTQVSAITSPALSDREVFQFLRCMHFEPMPEVTLQKLLISTLAAKVTHPERCLKLIKNKLDSLARRELSSDFQSIELTSQSLTRIELLSFLSEEGIYVAPPKSEVELHEKFQHISQIGRNWQRSIGGLTIPRATHEELISCINAKKKTVLLTGGPGFGKTCILLNLIDALESQANIASLYIQGREFAGISDIQDFEALGLPKDLDSLIARMSEYKHVVVVLDSLDVLSLVREHRALNFFLSLLDRLSAIENVTTITACRSFDVKYERLLSSRSWSKEISLSGLDWNSDVKPLLEIWKIPSQDISEPLQNLLSNPRLLSLFYEIHRRGITPKANSELELTEIYLEQVVLNDQQLGADAYDSIQKLASVMLEKRKIEVSKPASTIPHNMAVKLLSAGILVETDKGNYTFGHQTLIDVLAISLAISKNQTLLQFIQDHPPVPFIRPSIRTFFFHVRHRDSGTFRRQVRAVLDSEKIAFHLKRLIVESLAETVPNQEDWSLIRHIFRNQKALFDRLYSKAIDFCWLNFWAELWLPHLIELRDEYWLLRHISRTRMWLNDHPVEVIHYWNKVLSFEWIDQQDAVHRILAGLYQFRHWHLPEIDKLIKQIYSSSLYDPEMFGKSLSHWVHATNSGDDVLWGYITSNVSEAGIQTYSFKNDLRCAPHTFRNDDFLRERLCVSENLLNLALKAINEWSLIKNHLYPEEKMAWGFLLYSSHSSIHAGKRDMRLRDAFSMLLDGIEKACLHHAKENTLWWQVNKNLFLKSREGVLRYFGIKALINYPEENLPEVVDMLIDIDVLSRESFQCLLGRLLNSSFHMLPNAAQDMIQHTLLQLNEDLEEKHFEAVTIFRRDYLVEIPTHLRFQNSQDIIDLAYKYDGDASRKAEIRSFGGVIRSPISIDDLIGLRQTTQLQLLQYYDEPGTRIRDYTNDGGVVGGAEEIARVIRTASEKKPEYFLHFLYQFWQQINDKYKRAIVDGISSFVRVNTEQGSENDKNASPQNLLARHIASQLLSLFAKKTYFWQNCDEAASALQGCANIINSQHDADELTFLLYSLFLSNRPEESKFNDNDHVFVGINDTRGKAVIAAITLANRWFERGYSLPKLLLPALFQFARDEHPYIKILILQRLHVLQYYSFELGWQLFDEVMLYDDEQFYKAAYNCFYYGYHNHYEQVEKYLDLIRSNYLHVAEAAKLWGQIQTLACLSGNIQVDTLITSLAHHDNEAMWTGANRIFLANVKSPKCSDICMHGLNAVFEHAVNRAELTSSASSFFSTKDEPFLYIPETTLRLFFQALTHQEPSFKLSSLHDFDSWLVNLAHRDPKAAQNALEIALNHVDFQNESYYGGDEYAHLLTILFREAEQEEESDNGEFLKRVLAAQDRLIECGFSHIETWLQDAERP